MSVQSGDEATRVRAHLGDRIADLERDLAASCREQDALRTRLESAEAALRDAEHVLGFPKVTKPSGWTYEPVYIKQLTESIRAALGAAGERSEG